MRRKPAQTFAVFLASSALAATTAPVISAPSAIAHHQPGKTYIGVTGSAGYTAV